MLDFIERPGVTPCVGVWIETVLRNNWRVKPLSHPAWVCGLKPTVGGVRNGAFRSHPAWVCGLKLMMRYRISDMAESHPAWVCGLKLMMRYRISDMAESHPAWVCGLKHYAVMFNDFKPCHTLRGCVD